MYIYIYINIYIKSTLKNKNILTDIYHKKLCQMSNI